MGSLIEQLQPQKIQLPITDPNWQNTVRGALPKDVTDALRQMGEAVSLGTNPVTENLAKEGARKLLSSAAAAIDERAGDTNPQLREVYYKTSGAVRRAGLESEITIPELAEARYRTTVNATLNAADPAALLAELSTTKSYEKLTQFETLPGQPGLALQEFKEALQAAQQNPTDTALQDELKSAARQLASASTVGMGAQPREMEDTTRMVRFLTEVSQAASASKPAGANPEGKFDSKTQERGQTVAKG